MMTPMRSLASGPYARFAPLVKDLSVSDELKINEFKTCPLRSEIVKIEKPDPLC